MNALATASAGAAAPVLRVGVVDDHPTVRLGIGTALAARLPAVETVPATSLADLPADAELDLVVLDLHLADGSEPADNVLHLVGRDIPVLLHTQETRAALVARCLRAGARGIVSKRESLDVLAAAVQTVAVGGRWLGVPFTTVLEDGGARRVPELTPRELEAVRLYAGGLPLKSVARRMGVSAETAKEHLKRVRRKYLDAGRPARSKLDLLVRAVEDGHVASVDGSTPAPEATAS